RVQASVGLGFESQYRQGHGKSQEVGNGAGGKRAIIAIKPPGSRADRQPACTSAVQLHRQNLLSLKAFPVRRGGTFFTFPLQPEVITGEAAVKLDVALPAIVHLFNHVSGILLEALIGLAIDINPTPVIRLLSGSAVMHDADVVRNGVIRPDRKSTRLN